MRTPQCDIYRRDVFALLEDAPDEGASRGVLSHVAECPECRAEYEALRAITADLCALGNGIRKAAPEVDLRGAILTRVAKIKSSPSNIVPVARPRKTVAWLAGLAAAAAVVFAVSTALYRDARVAPTGPAFTAAPSGPVRAAQEKPVHVAAALQPSMDRLRDALSRLPQSETGETPKPAEMKATRSPELSALTPGDIYSLRKAAVTDASARTKLAQWARLTPEEALQVAHAEGSTPDALAGAAASLEPAAAEPLLLTAVGASPDKPSLRLALAKSFGGQPERVQEAEGQLEDLRALDPQNALAFYMEARLRLDQGDLEGALESLNQAQSLDTASAYSLEAALSRQQALIAAGMTPEAARALAALTAGGDERQFMLDLAHDLLGYGQRYIDQGDLATARQISEAVQSMGRQVDQGAALSQERLAGMDIQRQAVTLLETIYTTLGTLPEIEQLTRDIEQLAAQMGDFSGFLNSLNNLIVGAQDQLWDFIANLIPRAGDLNIFEYLPQ